MREGFRFYLCLCQLVVVCVWEIPPIKHSCREPSGPVIRNVSLHSPWGKCQKNAAVDVKSHKRGARTGKWSTILMLSPSLYVLLSSDTLGRLLLLSCFSEVSIYSVVPARFISFCAPPRTTSSTDGRTASSIAFLFVLPPAGHISTTK